MATLSPLGWLVLYIALAAAPPSADQITVHFSVYDRVVFYREDGSWSRINDLGEKIYARRDGTKLIFSDGGFPPEIRDLGSSFELTGKEDWSAPTVIYSRDKASQLDTSPGKNQLMLKTREDDRSRELLITWQASTP